jgi:hypothetical protein
MTTEQYWPIALDYILNAPETTFINYPPKITGIPDEFVKTTITDLEDQDLISTLIGGGIKVEQKGKSYLEKHRLGLEQKKDTPLISLHNVGNTYSNIQDSVLSIDTNLDKSKIVQQAKPEKKSIKGIVMVIIAILTLLIAGITFWLEHIKTVSK